MADLKTLYDNLGVTENLVVSERLRDAITDETGTGSLVFADSPYLENCDVPTPSTSDNSTKIATTAFVNNFISFGGGSSNIVSLSGTTQNMNLSSGNFFDGGTLTGDTTLTFSNIPTEIKWTYTFETGWDITDTSNVVYSGVPYLLNAANIAGDIFFKPDGTRMYVASPIFFGERIGQYNLTLPWDVTTGTSYDDSLNVASQEYSPTGIFFNPDGNRMYVSGAGTGLVYQYNLTVPWDVTQTVNFDDSLDISGQTIGPSSIFFKPDGTRMYILDTVVYQYNLTVPWDITENVNFANSFDISGQESSPQGIFFKPDGSRMYVTGSNGDDINQYNLTVPWDVTQTVNFDSVLDISGQETTPRGIFFKPDGTRLYVIGQLGDDINQYELFPYTISLPTSVRNFNYNSIKPGKNIIEFYTQDGGTNIYCNVY